MYLPSFDDLYGSFDPVDYLGAWGAFLAQLQLLRQALAANAYLLDNYLVAVLRIYEDRDLLAAYNAGANAFDLLRRTCRAALAGEEAEPTDYAAARAYLLSHPAPYRAQQTQLYYQSAMLWPRCLPAALARFEQAEKQHFICTKAWDELEPLQQKLSELCDAPPLERCHALLRRCLQPVPPARLFLQGLIDELSATLLTRDPASGKEIFRLLLEDT